MEGFESLVLKGKHIFNYGDYIIKREHTEDQLRFMQEYFPCFKEAFCKKEHWFPVVFFDREGEWVGCIEGHDALNYKTHFNDYFTEVLINE